MKKKRTGLLSILIAALLLIPANVLAASNVNVVIYGKNQEYDQPALVKEGRTLVPLRGIFESLNTKVEWKQNTQTITATNNIKGITIQLKIGSKVSYVNNKKVTLDVPAQVINNRTLVPLRFISESLGETVGWDKDSSTVYIGDYLSKADLIDAIGSNKTFLGESGRGEDGSNQVKWPFKLLFTSFDPYSEQFSGEIHWITLDAIHKVEGYIYGNQVFFEETEYIKQGDAILDCEYTLTPKDDERLSGTYGSCGNSGYAWVDIK